MNRNVQDAAAPIFQFRIY